MTKNIWRNTVSGCKPTWQCWEDMRLRCTNPKIAKYQSYGGRGIKVCDRWLNDFDAFVEDMGFKPECLTLERIDVNGDYEPGNCRWATMFEQLGNKRTSRFITFEGKTQTMSAWAREFEVSRFVIKNRLNHRSVEVVFSELSL